MKNRPKALPIVTNADRIRQKTSPAAIQPVAPPKPPQQTIMLFGCEHYPFPNEASQSTSLLKTVVNVSLTTTDLQKVIQLSHPNIVALRKIVRSGKASSNYAFCYEVVAYSLTDLIANPQEHPNLFSELILLNLRSILRSVVDYLEKAGIFYLTRLQDIGVTDKGTIKVYIPPKTVFQSSYSQSIHRVINEIGDWWEEMQGGMSRNQFRKEKKMIQLAPPKLEDCTDFDEDDGLGQLDATIEKEMGDLLADEDKGQEEVNGGPADSPIKMSINSKQSASSKIQKIGEQVRFLTENAKNRTRASAKPEVPPETKQRKKSKSPQGPQIPYTPTPQPVHQNINCINIFNHPTPMTPPAKIHYNYLTSPMDQGEFYMEHDQDEEYSQDTYDIEFENQFEPVTEETKKQNKLRQTFAQRAPNTEEYEQASPRKGAKREVVAMGGSTSGSFALCGRNVTESAGPMQFKSFVNRVIKPQTTQITEDESEKSSQPQSRRPKNQSQERPSGNYNTGLLKSGDLVLQRSSTKIDSGLGKEGQLQRKSGGNYSIPRRTDIMRNNSAGDMRRHGPLAEKVRQALEKTRNAIELLNKVKGTKKRKAQEMEKQRRLG